MKRTFSKLFSVACFLGAATMASVVGCSGDMRPGGGDQTSNASPVVATPAPLAYWNASTAIARYPKFGAARPAIMNELYPNGGGRTYPVCDAHVHNTFRQNWAGIKAGAGIYSANDVILNEKNVAGEDNGNGLGNENIDAEARLYPKPDVKAVNINDILDYENVPGMLAKMANYYRRGAGAFKTYMQFSMANQADDPRLFAVWERCAAYKWPVVFHVDGVGKIPDFLRLVKAHPKTIFQAAHMMALVDSPSTATAGLARLGTYLRTYPNLYVDHSARTRNLSEMNAAVVAKFFVDNQDKVLFGTDIGYTTDPEAQTVEVNVDGYKNELMYFETKQVARLFWWEGTHKGLGLPPAVLAKLYYQNYLKIYYRASNP
jgi:hypothetical protein